MFSVHCSPLTLGDLLRKVAPAISKRSTLPILGSILLEVKSGVLICSATNLDIGLQAWSFSERILEEGSIAVPAKALMEEVKAAIAKKIKTMHLFLDTESNQLLLKYEGEVTSLGIMDASEFPQMSVSPVTNSPQRYNAMTLDAESITRMQTLVAFSCAEDESRPVFTAICLQRVNTQGQACLNVIGADSFRCSWLQERLLAPKSFPTSEQSNILLPASSLAILAKVFPKSGSIHCVYTPDRSQLIFETDTQRLVARLVEGVFPDIQRAHQEKLQRKEESATHVTLNVPTMFQQCKTMHKYVIDRANIVCLIIKTLANGERVAILAGNNGIQDAQDRMGKSIHLQYARITGEDILITFNSSYLLGAFAAFESMHLSQVTLHLNGESKPVWFLPSGSMASPSVPYVHILMPMAYRDEETPVDVEQQLRILGFTGSTHPQPQEGPVEMEAAQIEQDSQENQEKEVPIEV